MDMVIFNNNNNNAANNVGVKKKTSLGRRKIALDKKIEKKSSLQVTFTKRRHGMFKKAAELSRLCGVDIAILVRSPAGKMFAFGSPSADAVVQRFQGESSSTSGQIVVHTEKEEKIEPTGQIVVHTEDEGFRDFEPTGQIVEHRERDFEPTTTSGQNVEKREDQFWWNKPIESMGKEELEQFALKLEALQQSHFYRSR